MPKPTLSPRSGNSGAEEAFIQLFCDAYGPERGQYVYLQYPFVDIYGGHRTIDYAFDSSEGRIAIEIDGNTWHQPDKVSEDKYHDDLLKQNSMVYEGWRVFRWTSRQLDKAPDRVKDELVTFLGSAPVMKYIDDAMPQQEGKTFSLMEHQEEALKNLQEMRDHNETIALLYHATGTGKTVTAVSDAKHVGRKTLFLAHTKELVYQAYETFRKLWPEVSVGRMVEGYKETDAFVLCGSIQSVMQNLALFTPDQFGYLVIDECHHGTADTYKKILSYFKPAFTLGLTATPERTDGEDLLAVFKNVAHKLDLQTAVELGTLVPVRCIRVKTNIDLHDVRSNGFHYNQIDLESKVFVPERNKLIVDTYTEYCCTEHGNKQTVVFCTSVKHAQEMEHLFQEAGISARAVSGSTNSAERKHILQQYEQGTIHVLLACDLLNEGWDSPRTQVLFMARPTMSKTIYMQQLGRGMRPCHDPSVKKDFLMVFDFVDNANMFNCPYSLHRLLSISTYTAGSEVLSTKHGYGFSPYAQGEKPDLMIDFPVHATDYEIIDLFNWQDKAKDMVSQVEFTRRVSAQSETIDRYIKDGKMVPEMIVPISEHRSFNYFTEDQVSHYAKQYGWKLITQANMKDLFFEMVRSMTMSYSYKPIFIKAFFDHMDEDGRARLEDVVMEFAAYYEGRMERGLIAEKKPCIFTKGGYTDKDVEKLILGMPFKRFEDMHFITHSKVFGLLQLDSNIFKRLTDAEKKDIYKWCDQALEKYFANT